jgi:hypothetical protein
MRSKTFTTVGSLHPVLFFVVVYVVALFFSIFICSSLFYSCNASKAKVGIQQEKTIEKATELPVSIANR